MCIFHVVSINTSSKAQQGIQSHIRHMARSEHLTYNIGESLDGHSSGTSRRT